MTINGAPARHPPCPLAEHGREEVLYSSGRTRVCRVRLEDGTGAVICKQPLGPGAVARVRHERAILERLAGVDGVPRLAAAPVGTEAVVMDDAGGTTLAETISRGWEIPALVELALGLAEVLAGVHRAGIAHKDINPANIVISGSGRTPTLIDFGLATAFVEERPGFTHASELSGTLAYLAPEQTGRTGRGVDQRADLYALGATLYELATGEPPFGTGDALQLIHDHLARTPRPPAELNPTVPAGLSAIILRLLEKEPDRRYQSADGLAHDLSRLRAGRTLTLGERDFPLRLTAPSQLVGREAEIATLRRAFDDACAGGGGGLLVSGSPGVGKTTLIDELRPIVTAAGGWFVTGKFDQFRQDPSADAVNQVMSVLGRMMLAEPEAEFAAQRARLLALLGPNAGLAAAMQQAFAILLGVAPERIEGDPRQVGARLVQSGLDLLRGVASATRPLVVVLDDLQWASGFPIGFVDAVLTDGRLPGLLLVGAYRDSEVDAAHPLTGMMARWQQQGAVPPLLRLENLPPTDLGAMLGTMLRLPPEEAAELAGPIRERTDGNPYDTVELVNALRQDGALVPGSDGWSWEASTIRRHIGTGDVATLIGARIDRLPAPGQALLEIMACLGGAVDLPLLCAAADLPADELHRRLAPALEDGLLVTSPGGSLTEAGVRFRHDRVHQAAYSRLAPDLLRELQLTLARRLGARPEFAAIAAEQYLPVIDAVVDPAERRQVAERFRRTASHTRLINPGVTERFLSGALRLLSAGSPASTSTGPTSTEPEVDPGLLAAVQSELHGALYHLGRLEEADRLYTSITETTTEPLSLARATCVQISSLTIRRRSLEAVALGLDLLARLGLSPPEDLEAAIDVRLDVLARWAFEADPDAEQERPELTDPTLLAMADLLNRLRAAAYNDQVLYSWLSLESHRLWVEHGPYAPTLAAVASAPALFIGHRADYRTGYEVTRTVMAVGQARGYTSALASARFSFVAQMLHWFEPLEDAVRQARAAREALLHAGDLQFGAFTYPVAVQAMLDCAPTLDACSDEIETGLGFVARTGDGYIATTLRFSRQFVRALRGETDGEGSFSDSSFDDTTALVGASPLITALFHTERARCAAVFADTPTLIEHADLAMRVIPSLPAPYASASARLLQAIALAERIRTAPPDERAPLLTELDALRDWLAGRAADAPGNFGHLLGWVEAERAWAVDEFREATLSFDGALRDVEARQRPWHAALIAERAGRFHLAHGLQRTGRLLLIDARRHYQAWGATGKVAQLDRIFPFLGATEPARQRESGSVHSVVVSSEAIDLMAVLQASQALSSETNLDRLQARVVEVLSTMTGATAVQVLLWNKDSQRWYLLAPGGQGEKTMSVDDAGTCGLLPMSAFRFVERTREPLLVRDATRDSRFGQDPYLAGLEHCSMLVVPVLAQGAPRAMLLLENRLTQGMFSPARLDAVTLVAGQLAICLDNALAERFRSLVQRSSDVTLVCDHEGVLSYASAASAGMLGIDDALLAGRSVLDFVQEEDRARLREHLAETDQGGTVECRLLNVHGRQPWVEMTSTDLSSDPAVGGIVLHLRDVTERRRLESELRHAQKLESVGQLASGIAHEINTPIQFVADNIRFLSEAFADFTRIVEAGDACPEIRAEVDTEFLLQEVPQAIEQTLDGVSRVATIVKAMKAFGHPGGEQKSLADLNEAVRNTLVVASSEVKYVADVVTDLADLPPVWCILGDINQVVLNLVVNAAHAIGEAAAQGRGRGTITLRTRVQAADVVLEVTDTGVGIPPEIADRVFDQFFTTKAVGVGTGQGLSVTYSLVHDRHGGTVSFISEPGSGTTFIVRLPYAQPDRPRPA